MSDTPETDAVENEWRDSWSRRSGQEEMAAIARKMERERDHARAEAELFRNNALSVLRGDGGTFPVGNQFSWENDQGMAREALPSPPCSRLSEPPKDDV